MLLECIVQLIQRHQKYKHMNGIQFILTQKIFLVGLLFLSLLSVNELWIIHATYNVVRVSFQCEQHYSPLARCFSTNV